MPFEPPPQDPPTPAPAPGELYRLAWTFYLVMALAGLLWIGLRLGPLPLGLFVDVHGLARDLMLGVAGGLLLVVAWQLPRRWFAPMRHLEAEMLRLTGLLGRSEVFALALISGFSEELFFRGAVQGSWGWVAATLIFGLLHTGPGKVFRVWSVFALGAGLLFAGLTLWRGNLLPAMVAHFLVNWINLQAMMKQASKASDSGV